MKSTCLCLIILILLFEACTPDSGKEPVVIAEVGPQRLTMVEAKGEIPTHIFESDSIAAYIKYRDDWVRRQVILQEAERLNFTRRKGVEEKLQRIRE